MMQRKLPEHIDYPDLLWRRKWLILLAVIVGAGIGVARVILQPPVYPAYTTIEVLSANDSFLGVNIMDFQGSNATNIQTQTRILMSSALLNRTSDRTTLELPPQSPPAPDLFGRARNRLGLLAQEPVELTKQGIRMAAGSLRARAVGATRLVELSCESISPDTGIAFLSALTSEYISQFSQQRSTHSSRTAQWLEGQLEETKNRAEQADQKVRDFMRRTGSLYVGEHNPMAAANLQQLRMDLSNAQTDRVAKQSRLEALQSGGSSEIQDNPSVRALRDKLAEARRQEAQMLQVMTPEHDRIKRFRAQLVEIQQELTATTERAKEIAVQRARADLQASERQEQLISRSYSGQVGSLISQADKSGEYAMLQREAEAARQTYNMLRQQLNQTTVATALPTNYVRVIDPPGASSVPLRPKPSSDIVKATLFLAAAAISLIVGLELIKARRLSRVFAAPGHSANLLDVPELGVIPSFGPAAPLWGGFPDSVRRLARTGANVPEPDPPNSSAAAAKTLIVWQEKPSFAAESFRFALTSLFGGAGASRKVIVITSPGPGEGKTTLVGNLAVAIAETGKRVLLVDADLRRPRLHRLFQLQDVPGLRDLIISDLPAEDVDLVHYIQPSAVPGVSLLASGYGPQETATPLLFSHRVPVLLDRLRRDFDIVLIDTAPALHFADSRLLGRFSDGVVLVVRSGVTFRESAVSVRALFAAERIPVVGTVLNDWTPEGADDTYQTYARYYHERRESSRG
ncbi:MAG: AAA family ATPase [Bryobacteraceae bacterium]|nr:AAA family ATPase [Bryobacteraceae bacterium]